MRAVELFAAMTADMNPLRDDAALTERPPVGGLIMQASPWVC
jgi:acyl dehydratase